MLCQSCNEQEANVRYTQVINGEKREMILCSDCAKKLGIENHFDMPIQFSNFFAGFGEMLGGFGSDFMPTLNTPKRLTCETCGLTYDNFISTGKFGCGNCYTTFESKLGPILKSLHGETQYLGRKAKGSGSANQRGGNVKRKEVNEIKKANTKEEKIATLKQELKQMIKEEKYEQAARVRDEIKKLEE